MSNFGNNPPYGGLFFILKLELICDIMVKISENKVIA